MDSTAKQLRELNNLYAECQQRPSTPEEAARMQELYNAIAEEASIGMWASPRDRQYFYIEAK